MIKKLLLGLGAVLFVFALGVVLAIPSGFMIMLVAGAIHHDVIPQLPAFSFWQAILLHFGLVVVGSYFKSSNAKSE